MTTPSPALTRRISLWARSTFNVLWLVVLAGYLMVVAAQAVYKTYQDQKDITRLEQKLQSDVQERERLQALLVYYQSDSFKEKELRRVLLLQMPNEKVYALPESSTSRQLEEETVATTDTKQPQAGGPIWRQWLNYLLNRPS